MSVQFLKRTPIGLLVCAAIAACTPEMPEEASTGSVVFAVSLAADECGVVKANATVDGDDLSSAIGPEQLTITAQKIEGTVDNIPAGTARTVTVQAFDQSNQVVYQGTQLFDVLANQATSIDIVLYRNFANCPASTPQTPTGFGSLTVGGSISNDFLDFAFSHAAMDDGGVVYMLDGTSKLVRRYDITAGAFLAPLATPPSVNAMAVAPAGDNVYVSYGKRMDVIDVAAETRAFFTASPEAVSTLAVVGPYLFTIDASGAWNTHSLYNRQTALRTASVDWREASKTVVFAAALNKIFYLSDGTSPNDIHYSEIDVTNGTFGAQKESPYHGDYSLGHPLRLFPDNSKILVATGIAYNTSDLTYANSMGMAFVDAAFHNNQIYILQAQGGNSAVTVLDQKYAIKSATFHVGAPLRLFVHGDDMLVICSMGASLRFTKVALN